jgi:photosystem II stability/assembly factor-like uncharacterized protein
MVTGGSLKKHGILLLIGLLTWIGSAEEGWHSMVLPSRDDLHDVFFLDDSIGWSLSYGTGLIFKTTNSGATWKIISRLDSAFYEQIQFVSREVGWLCGGDGELRKSTDGGYTWARVSIPRPPNVDLALLYAMHFRNESNGFLSGGYLNFKESKGHKYMDWENGSYFVLQTTDAGNSWSRIEFSPATMLFDFQFPNDSVCFASGNSIIYRSSDHGENWQVSFLDTNKIISNIRSMYFLDSQNGCAASWNGCFLRTTDGGDHWTTKYISKGPLRSLCFVNETVGYIVGNADETGSSMHMTQDSGKTWKPVFRNQVDLHRIRRSSTILWACGKGGTVMRNNLGQ